MVSICSMQGRYVSPTFTTFNSFLYNSLPNDKIFDRSKLKAFADDKINMTEKMEFVLGRLENIVGNGENAGYQHWLP